MIKKRIEPQTKQIGEFKFKTVPFMAIEAIKLHSKLAKIFAPSLGRIISSVKLADGVKKTSDLLNSKLDGNQISQALQDFVSQLDENQLLDFIKTMIRNTSVEFDAEKGKRIFLPLADNDEIINAVFTSNTLMIYKVILFVLGVNFPDFLALLGGVGTRFQTILSKQVEVEEKPELKE